MIKMSLSRFAINKIVNSEENNAILIKIIDFEDFCH